MKISKNAGPGVFAFFLLGLAAASPSLGHARPLQGLPESIEAKSDGFVTAWISLRKDIDALATSGVHPAQVTEWFRAMPAFLLRDVAHLATNPEVVHAAARRLAKLGGRANRRFLAELAVRYRASVFEPQLRALQIVAGDGDAKRKAVSELDHRLPVKRTTAAIVLLLAGEKLGLEFMERAIQGRQSESAIALIALGRYGREQQRNLLERMRAADLDNGSGTVALGEFYLRKFFPFHHQLLIARNPLERVIPARGGLTESWLSALGKILGGNGVRTSSRVLTGIETMRLEMGPGEHQETERRRLAALIEFWRDCDAAIEATAATPRWPVSYAEAMRVIHEPSGRSAETAAKFARRVTAELSVCAALGSRIGHPQHALNQADLEILTPGGDRAVDGNFATAWHAKKGDRLIVEHGADGLLKTAMVSGLCPLKQKSYPTVLIISGSGNRGDWMVTRQLSGRTKYFEKVKVDHLSARRITVRVKETGRTGREPACIAELRLKFEH